MASQKFKYKYVHTPERYTLPHWLCKLVSDWMFHCNM